MTTKIVRRWVALTFVAALNLDARVNPGSDSYANRLLALARQAVAPIEKEVFGAIVFTTLDNSGVVQIPGKTFNATTQTKKGPSN